MRIFASKGSCHHVVCTSLSEVVMNRVSTLYKDVISVGASRHYACGCLRDDLRAA